MNRSLMMRKSHAIILRRVNERIQYIMFECGDRENNIFLNSRQIREILDDLSDELEDRKIMIQESKTSAIIKELIGDKEFSDLKNKGLKAEYIKKKFPETKKWFKSEIEELINKSIIEKRDARKHHE